MKQRKFLVQNAFITPLRIQILDVLQDFNSSETIQQPNCFVLLVWDMERSINSVELFQWDPSFSVAFVSEHFLCKSSCLFVHTSWVNI